MRIVITADTHYHTRYADALIRFVSDVAALKPDCFILAGDIGERLQNIRNMLHLLQ